MLADASPFPAGGDNDRASLRDSGLAAMLLAVFATAIPGLRGRLRLPWLLRLRQPIGGLALAYALAHVLLVLDASGGNPGDLLREAAKEPTLLAGIAAFVLALPLAATSNRLALRWLGAPAWQDIQRSLGIVAALATVHSIDLVGATPRLVIVLLAAATLVWLAFSTARSLRDQVRHTAIPPTPPGERPLRFYRRPPR